MNNRMRALLIMVLTAGFFGGGYSGLLPQAAALAATTCGFSGYQVFTEPDVIPYSSVAVGPADVWAGSSERFAHWDGAKWQDFGFPDGVTGTISSMVAIASNDVWAVGVISNYQESTVRPLALHWDGTSWQQAAIAGEATSNQLGGYLRAVAATGPNNIWIAGHHVYHYNGLDWVQLTDIQLGVPEGSEFYDVEAISNSNIWLAGYEVTADGGRGSQILLQQTDNGWEDHAHILPPNFNVGALTTVQGQAGVWAVGNGSAHWDGDRWTAIPMPTDRFFQKAVATADGQVWALSANEVGEGGGTQIAHWDGKKWNMVHNYYQADPATYLESLAVEAPNDVWALGQSVDIMPRGNTTSSPLAVHIFDRCQTPVAEVADPKKPDTTFFRETGHTLGGKFLAYWNAHGGLAQFGYPITEEFQEKSTTDGKLYTVQYFQRNRFELHPENAGTDYEVLLGLLGRTVTENGQVNGPFDPVAQAADGARFFPETGHNLAPEFADYWAQHGGLSVYGYPISEPFVESKLVDGKYVDFKVQYFERNRLEYHPEYKGTASEVLLGLLGAEILKRRGWID